MDRAISLESRRVDLSIELPFILGRARIDPPAHEITTGRKSERMQPQTMKVLVALHDKTGQVVTRDELIARCWDGRIVTDDVINRCILLLRRLADESRDFRIETVPRAGYRLIEAEPTKTSTPKRRWIGAAAAVGVAAAGIIGSSSLDRPPPSQGMPPTPSVSVVPFTADRNDPLTKQVADAAAVPLSHMLSQSGFAIVRDDPIAARDNSKTDYIFSGSVRRTEGSINASVQLVSKRDRIVVFAHDFSAPIDQAADLPDRIGATAAAELAWTGAEMLLDPREHLDPQVASELMTSMNLTIEEGDSMRAYQLARHAAGLAPNSAMAQLTLAVQTRFSLSLIPREQRAEALALGRRASERARVLAPEFGDVYLMRCLLRSPVRLIECEADGRRGLEVDPRSSFVPGFLSTVLYAAGRNDEALYLANQSWANDPYKPAKLARMVQMFELTGDRGAAERVYREAIRLWPQSYRIRAGRLIGLAERGDLEGIAAFTDPKLDAPMLAPTQLAALATARRQHDVARARRACSPEGLRYLNRVLCMTVLAELGDRQDSWAFAIDFFPIWRAHEKVDEDQFWLDNPDGFDVALLTGPAARAIREDPRFLYLAEKLGLLAYWRSSRLPDFCTKGHEPVCAEISRKPI